MILVHCFFRPRVGFTSISIHLLRSTEYTVRTSHAFHSTSLTVFEERIINSGASSTRPSSHFIAEVSDQQYKSSEGLLQSERRWNVFSENCGIRTLYRGGNRRVDYNTNRFRGNFSLSSSFPSFQPCWLVIRCPLTLPRR